MAKTLKRSRLSRFKDWSPEHQARVLADAGVRPEDFGGLSTGERRSTLDKAISAGRRMDAPGGLTQVPTLREATVDAQRLADLQFGPQQQSLATQAASLDPWFQQYTQRVQGAQGAAQAQTQPVIAQAQGYQAQTGAQLPPGLDPSSPAYAQAQQAAQGRAAIAQLGVNALQTNAQATQDYFGGLATTAQRELPQAKMAVGAQQRDLESRRGDAVRTFLSDARTNAQNFGIANATLGLNTTKAAADTDIARGVDPVTGKALPDPKAGEQAAKDADINKYGISNSEWRSMTNDQRQKIIRNFNKGTGSSGEKARKEAEKKAAAIKTSTGKVQVDVGNVIAKWDSYRGQQTDDTSKPKLPDGSYPARNLTPSDIKRILGEKYDPQLIHVSLLVRAGKALDQAAIDYLHSKDPNIRIPREWIRGKQGSKTLVRPGVAKAPKGDRSGMGDRPN